MRKLLKSAKAMSPVIAAIILIAVTVAVSIAVAAWMGALTFTFMGGAEELKITGHAWGSAPVTYINLTVTNVGSAPLSIQTYWVGNNRTDLLDPITLNPGKSDVVKIDGTFDAGTKYEFALVTKTGNKYGYTARCPE